SVQVHGAEHFNRFVTPWSCTAAPVRDLQTGALIGVIDVTGGDDAASGPARMLVDATARAVEGELLAARLRTPMKRAARGARQSVPTRATLSVLGRDDATLTVASGYGERTIELGLRHAELVLMLAVHRHGLTAERLAELVYGSHDAVGTLRPEMVRLRKRIDASFPDLVPQSRPYRIPGDLESDAQHVLSLLDRGAHRVALSAYRGEVLPGSTAPGVDELREQVTTAIRETMLSEAAPEVLTSYLDTDLGADDTDAMRQALALLPAKSPKRAGLVARLERLS
ncbi:MAG: transcriptional regulator, partial [Microbacterium sp.]